MGAPTAIGDNIETDENRETHHKETLEEDTADGGLDAKEQLPIQFNELWSPLGASNLAEAPPCDSGGYVNLGDEPCDSNDSFLDAIEAADKFDDRSNSNPTDTQAQDTEYESLRSQISTFCNL